MKEKKAEKSSCPTLITFPQLVQHIKELDHLLKREEIENLLLSLVCEPNDYQKFTGYAEPYSRISVVKSESGVAELLVMTWHSNQQSLIHDHFQSACGIRVLQGQMTETLYDLGEDNKVRQNTAKDWMEGEITSSLASLDIHKISNTDETTLVTLHIYSAPLDPTKMRFFVEMK